MLRFLFDAHVHRAASEGLRERGIDVVHVVDLDLGGAPDHVLFERAATEGRIVVTRDVADFAALVDAYARADLDHPGVLFLPGSIDPADPGAHVRALGRWLEEAGGGENPVRNTYGWLRADPDPD